jgi:hypothetical protein
MKTTKENFFAKLNESNYDGKRQIRDIMPSAASIKIENGETKTTWKCQKSEVFVFGWTIARNGGIEYFLNA